MFKKIREFRNGQQMAVLRPSAVLFDMNHRFVMQQAPESAKAAKTLFSRISVNGANFNYDYESPQNRVLRHGILYNTLLKIYINALDTAVYDSLLQKDDKDDKRPKIDFIEYNSLPECYQQAFVPYDDDYYVLNVNKTSNDIVIKIDNKNKANVIKLLKRAKMLLPVIYKTETRAKSENPTETYEVPAFVTNPLSAYFVSDEQLKTISELHNVFTTLATMTMPVKNPVTKAESANTWALYNEYVASQSIR